MTHGKASFIYYSNAKAISFYADYMIFCFVYTRCVCVLNFLIFFLFIQFILFIHESSTFKRRFKLQIKFNELYRHFS